MGGDAPIPVAMNAATSAGRPVAVQIGKIDNREILRMDIKTGLVTGKFRGLLKRICY
jgi:hypothetical protein